MIRREVCLFGVNGTMAVAIAYGVYRYLVAAGLELHAANALAYIAGMAYGFFANRALAFRDDAPVSASKMLRYGLLHVCTLALNVTLNSALLDALPGARAHLLFAFLPAVAVSAAVNFVGLKYWVFRNSRPPSTGAIVAASRDMRDMRPRP